MEKLVSYELAKLAEKKGFDYSTDRVYLSPTDVKLQDALFNYPKAIYKNRIYAPTQSFLQRWIREKHHIHINVRATAFMDKENIGYTWDIFGFYDGRFRLRLISSDISMKNLHDDKEEFNTYEEALEIALLESLKLIK